MMTIPEMIAVLQAAQNGKKIERRTHGESEWWKLAIEYEDWNFSKYDFRIAPEPRRVPLGPEDVPPGSVFKLKSWKPWQWEPMFPRETFALTGISVPVKRTYDEMNDDECEISRDGGKTWQPCWKEEV